MGAMGTISAVLTASGVTTVVIVASAQPVSTFIETKDLYLDSLELVKFIQRIRYGLKSDFAPALSVSFKVRDHVYESHFTIGPFVLVDDKLDKKVRGASLIRIKFEDASVTNDWLLSWFELWGQTGGQRTGGGTVV